MKWLKIVTHCMIRWNPFTEQLDFTMQHDTNATAADQSNL